MTTDYERGFREALLTVMTHQLVQNPTLRPEQRLAFAQVLEAEFSIIIDDDDYLDQLWNRIKEAVG